MLCAYLNKAGEGQLSKEMKQSEEKPLKSALKKYSSGLKKRVTWDPEVRDPLPRRRKRKSVTTEENLYLSNFSFKNKSKKTNDEQLPNIFNISSEKTSTQSEFQKRIVWFNHRSYENNPYFQTPIRVNSCCI